MVPATSLLGGLALTSLLGSAVGSSTSSTFKVAEVKPHFQCTNSSGQDRVRDYVKDLVTGDDRVGLVALIQFEFTLDQPQGYSAIGASCCTKHGDSAVVLVDEEQFDIMSLIGDTSSGNYSDLPFVGGLTPTTGSMCVADPVVSGERAYASAVLKHKKSAEEFCLVAGTFPHCNGTWTPEFAQALGSEGCAGRQILFIVDSNAGCPLEGPATSKASMFDIGTVHNMSWTTCSDPAIESPDPTCCHDISQGFPEARFWYDRTALCNGKGQVTDFQVHKDFVCMDNEEHKFTTSTVSLSTDLVAYV